MLQKFKPTTTETITEYGEKKGEYFLEAPKVDLQFLETLDYREVNVSTNNPFCWVFDAVLEEFNNAIDVTDSDEEDEIEEYEEDYEYIEEDDIEEDDEDTEEYYEEVEEEVNSLNANTILETYINQLPKEVSKPLKHMIISNSDLSYKVVLCMDNLGYEEKINIFKEYLKNELLFKIKYNIIYGESCGFQTDLSADIDDIMLFLNTEKDYELMFYILMSVMYAYRLSFALMEHSEDVYNHISEQLFNAWNYIEDILSSLKINNKDALSKIADNVYDYLHIFKKHCCLSILDSKMYLSLLILNYKADDEIILHLSETMRNKISKRYLELAQYVIYKNQLNPLADVMYKNMDDTNKILLSDIYSKYDIYEQTIILMEDVRKNTQNKKACEKALEDLEYVYEELNMHKELQDIYYQQLQNGNETVFKNICDYIYRESVSKDKNELENILETAREKLSTWYYIQCLINCGFYDKCIDIIKNAQNGFLLSSIGDVLTAQLDFEYHSDEFKTFFHQALEELSKNKRAVRSEKIKNLIEKYLK